jgi:hypothetical protein
MFAASAVLFVTSFKFTKYISVITFYLVSNEFYFSFFPFCVF